MTCNLPNTNGRCPNNNPDACPWYINAPKYNNCFWVYIKAVSAADGSMPEHSQNEIARLLGCSSTKAFLILKEAQVKLEEALVRFKAKQLLKPNDE